MNKISATMAVSIIALIAALIPPAAQAEMKEVPPGLWEMRMKMEIPGMPPEVAAKMGEGRVMTHCMKSGEKKWHELQRGPAAGQGKCDPVESKVEGNKISWSLKCADGTTGEGVVTHNGKDVFNANTTMNSPRGSMKMSIEGKRISETCESTPKGNY